jgi:DNA-binding MarR family transcriptional regulator
MTDTDILILRKMLKILSDIGPGGLEEGGLKEQAELAAGQPLTTVEKDLAVKTLSERGWIASYRNSITGRVRWYVTDQGKAAYAAL